MHSSNCLQRDRESRAGSRTSADIGRESERACPDPSSGSNSSACNSGSSPDGCDAARGK